MTYHQDPDVERALICLNDALCSYERMTGREYTLILVPHHPTEDIHMSMSGKPMPLRYESEPEQLVTNALIARIDNAPPVGREP